ncbi:MAG: hypothetical protein ACK5QW_08170 [Cyanobacteriota bacterium]
MEHLFYRLGLDPGGGRSVDRVGEPVRRGIRRMGPPVAVVGEDG